MKKLTRLLLNSLSLFVTVLMATSIVSSVSLFGAEPGSIGFMTKDRDVAAARYFLMSQEKEEIFATYYLWDGDRMGAAALAMLRNAAKSGTRVRIVFDGYSTIQMQNAPASLKKALEAVSPSYPISHTLMKALMEDGVEIRIFNPVRAEEIRKLLPPAFNTRSHNKLTWLKSQKVVLEGDRNWQNANFKMVKGSDKNYRSVEAVYSGNEANHVGTYLNSLWDNEEWVKTPKLKAVDPKEVLFEKSRLDKYFSLIVKKMGEFTPKLTFKNESGLKLKDLVEMMDVERIQFVADPVGRKRLDPGMEVDLYRLYESAKKKIIIVSPYINLTKKFKTLLKKKVTEDNVELIIVTPSLESTDAPISTMAFAGQAQEILSWGAKIYQHQGPDFLHAKIAMTDDDQVIVMAHNQDFFSEFFNYESGVLVKSKAYYSKVDEFVQSIIKDESLPYTSPKSGRLNRCMGWVLRMFSEKFPLPSIDPILREL